MNPCLRTKCDYDLCKPMGTTANQKKLFFNLRKAKSKISALEEGDPAPRLSQPFWVCGRERMISASERMVRQLIGIVHS